MAVMIEGMRNSTELITVCADVKDIDLGGRKKYLISVRKGKSLCVGCPFGIRSMQEASGRRRQVPTARSAPCEAERGTPSTGEHW